MNNSSLELFGRALIHDVRDSSYRKYLCKKGGKFKTDSAEKLRDLMGRISDQDALDAIVLEIIDSVIFRILVMFEENEANLSGDWGSFNAMNDSDGLSGEIFGEDGWIEKFSAYKPSEYPPVATTRAPG